MRIIQYSGSGSGFAGFGDVLPVVAAEYNKAMDATEAAVREAVVVLRTTAANKSFFDFMLLGPWGAITASDVPTQITSFLNGITNRVVALRTSRANVLAGTLPLEKWVASNRELIVGMNDLADYLGKNDVTLRASSTVAQALSTANSAVAAAVSKAKEIVDAAKKAGEGITTWGPFVAVGVGLIGLAVAWKALFR